MNSHECVVPTSLKQMDTKDTVNGVVVGRRVNCEPVEMEQSVFERDHTISRSAGLERGGCELWSVVRADTDLSIGEGVHVTCRKRPATTFRSEDQTTIPDQNYEHGEGDHYSSEGWSARS